MKLPHPIPADKLQTVLDKYGERSVFVFNRNLGCWLGAGPSWVPKKRRWDYRFRFAYNLVLVSAHLAAEGTEYWFIDSLGEEKAGIREFGEDEIYNCSTVTFDRLANRNE